MGLFDRCKREEFIEIDGEKVSLKGKTPDEIAKIRNDAALKASDYNDDEHAIPIGDLEQKLRSEFAEFDVQNYSLQKGLSFEDRKNLSGLAPRNKLTPKAVKPEWLKFVEQMTGFFALLLWGGSVLCFIGYGLRGEADNLYLGIVLAAVVFITGCFSYSQEAKSANLMAQFSKMMAEKITCQTDKAFDQKTDQWHNDNTRFDPIFLERGDIVLLKGGDNVPADCRLLDSNDFKVDNSPLTGEPDALERTADECKIADPKEATNLIFYGTAAKQGKCRAVVLKIGDDTFIGRIARLTASTANEQTPINKEIHHFISIVSAVAITLGVVFFIVGLALKTDPITNLVFMIGIIVANVPEGLLATVTVCLTLTSKSMAAKSVLVKNMEGVETLGSTTAICSDKTGTLTQNKMTVAELLYDQDIRRTPFVQPDPRANYTEIHSSDATFQEFLRAMLLNTTASFKPSQVLGSKDNDFQDRVPFYMKGEAADSIPLIQWNTVGDASEASIIKLAQFMRAIDLWHQDELPSQPERVLQMHEKDLVVEYRREQDPAGVGEPVATIPFNSANKYHVVVTANAGNEEFPFTVWMKGAPERITTRCGKVMHVGKPVELTDSRRDQILAKQGELMKKGRRVLAFAKRDIPASMVPPERQRVVMKEINGKQVEVPETYNFETQLDKLNFPMGETDREVNGEIIPPATEQAAEKLTLIGMAALIDPPRPSVPSAVLSCQMAGVRVVMVTGDHPTTAAAIAKMVNIISGDYKVMGPCVQQEEFDVNTGTVNTISADPLEQKNSARAIVVPGWEFTADTTDEKWRYIFAHNEIVFARTSPQQKLQIVQRFQQMEKEIVAVTGDGVNDAPALKKADIGVAMGIAGTEVSKSAADMILMDDNFTSIVNGVEEGRLIFDNLKKSIAYTLSSNIPEIAPFLIFITVQTPLPLSTVLILCIDLGTDMVPAISMAWENAESDIMRRPARDSAVDRLVTRKLVSFAYLQIGVIQAIAGFFTWFVVMNDYGFPPHIMPRLGTFDNYGKQVLYCQLEGGTFRNLAGETFNAAGASARDALDAGFVFWDEGEKGIIQECLFAPRNLQIDSSPDISDLSDASQFTGTNNVRVVTADAIRAVRDAGYVEYIPWKGVQSPFWRDDWLSWDVSDSDVVGLGNDVDEQILHQYQPIGLWDNLSNLDSADAIGTGPALDLLERKVGNKDTYEAGTFFQPAEGVTTGPVAELAGVTRKAGRIHVNVASRMIQKEALHHAQCAYFVCIVIVQWADLLICKTRWLSIYHQGMRNPAMNFGLVFETILASALCYITALNTALGTRNLRALHWVPAVPFSISIFLYDEIRKYIMRATSPETIQNKQVVRNYGWLARQTYY